MIMGTLGYMAPEQLCGAPADHRSDLFSLGCVLYEMLSGRQAFPGATAPEVAGAVLRSDPPPLTDVDPDLCRIVSRCLAKRPEERFQSVHEMASELRAADRPETAEVSGTPRRRLHLGHALAVVGAVVLGILFVLPPEGLWQRLTSTPQETEVRSIAVLPLENLSGDPEQEFFADGMTDELIMNLAKIEALSVISRTTAMLYKRSDAPLPQIASELGVDTIIEGTVLRVEDSVRITVQLIDGASDRHLWADSYQRPLQDILMLQSEVARAVAREIQVALTPSEERRLSRTESVDPAAHEAYLKGLHHFLRFTGSDIRRALEYYEQATELDPGYADAYVGLATAHLNSTFFLSLPPAVTVPAARKENSKALELDPANSGAVLNRAWIEMTYDWDWQGSERSHNRALELSPGWAYVHNNHSYMLACTGRFDEALEHVRRAQRLDPLSPVVGQHVGWVLYLARRYDEAIIQLEKTIELNPYFWFAHLRLAHVLLATGEYEKGIEAARRAIDLAGPETIRNGRPVLAQILAASGRQEDALSILAELETIARSQYLPPTDIARVYAALNRADDAFRWLEKALTVHDADLFMTKVWPAWDPIRDDPRFEDLLRRLNF